MTEKAMDNVMSPGQTASWRHALCLLREVPDPGERKEVAGFLLGWYFLGEKSLQYLMGWVDFSATLALCRHDGIEPEALGHGPLSAAPAIAGLAWSPMWAGWRAASYNFN